MLCLIRINKRDETILDNGIENITMNISKKNERKLGRYELTIPRRLLQEWQHGERRTDTNHENVLVDGAKRIKVAEQLTRLFVEPENYRLLLNG